MRNQKTFALVGMVMALALSLSVRAQAAETVQAARDTLSSFLKTDPGLSKFVQNSAGYAVFPSIGKGAIGIGGAHGDGILFERGKAIGKASMTQISVGLQLGGQTYSEIIFFQTPEALAAVKEGNFSLSAQASAVALKSGVSSNARYKDQVAVFTQAQGGLMYEASIGGQKFKFEPFGNNM
jgi:lipid-binding SYLF domain-containing protein